MFFWFRFAVFEKLFFEILFFFSKDKQRKNSLENRFEGAWGPVEWKSILKKCLFQHVDEIDDIELVRELHL